MSNYNYNGLLSNDSYRLMWSRMNNGSFETPPSKKPAAIQGVLEQELILDSKGGYEQQNRMIKDKRRTLDRAVLYSYQGAWVKKITTNNVQTTEQDEVPRFRALMNPNKLKQDYDEKIISIGFESGFKPGDVFEWCNTNSYWLIYLQELSELSYFRGQVRRCCYQINWTDEDGEAKTTHVAVRGPVETRLDWIDKHSTIVDQPNYSLHILMPKTPDTMKQFVRYSKFYLSGADEPDSKICWRVEATDSFSAPGVLELEAVEYYANKDEDNISEGTVGTLLEESTDPNPDTSRAIIFIDGETFIKPKQEYIYTLGIKTDLEWQVKQNVPVTITSFIDDNGYSCAKIIWRSTYSGEFELSIGNYKKTIVVETLF